MADDLSYPTPPAAPKLDLPRQAQAGDRTYSSRADYEADQRAQKYMQSQRQTQQQGYQEPSRQSLARRMYNNYKTAFRSGGR